MCDSRFPILTLACCVALALLAGHAAGEAKALQPPEVDRVGDGPQRVASALGSPVPVYRFVGARTSTSMGPGRATRTFTGHLFNVAADVSVYEEDVLVPLDSDLNQGVVVVSATSPNIVCSAQNIDPTNRDVHCTAELVPTFGLPPAFVLTLASQLTALEFRSDQRGAKDEIRVNRS